MKKKGLLMFDAILHDLRLLWKSEALIVNVWVNLALRRGTLLLLASLICAFGLAMLNLAGFYALQPSWGAVDAAAIVGVADIILAGALAVVASRSTPGSELDFALEVRREAMAAITNDAVLWQAPFEGLRADIRGVGNSVRGFLHNPLGAAGGKLLIPAVVTLIRALRSHKTTLDTTAQ
jgi:hypothetical protein